MVWQETAIHGSKVPRASTKASKEKEAQSKSQAGRWTPEEHLLFLQGLDQHGKEWKKISKMVKSRTLVQIRSHAQKYFQKLAATTEREGGTLPNRILLMNGKRGDKKGKLCTTVVEAPPAATKKGGSSRKSSSSRTAPALASSSAAKKKAKKQHVTRGSSHAKATSASAPAPASRQTADDLKALGAGGAVMMMPHHSVSAMVKKTPPESDVESDGSSGMAEGSTSTLSVDSMSEQFMEEDVEEVLDLLHPDDMDLFLNDLFLEAHTQRAATPTVVKPCEQRPAVPAAPAYYPIPAAAPVSSNHMHPPSRVMCGPPVLSGHYLMESSAHTTYAPQRVDSWMTTVEPQPLPPHLTFIPFDAHHAP